MDVVESFPTSIWLRNLASILQYLQFLKRGPVSTPRHAENISGIQSSPKTYMRQIFLFSTCLSANVMFYNFSPFFSHKDRRRILRYRQFLKNDPVFHPSIRKRVPQSLPKVRIELGQNIARSKAEPDSVKDRETENTSPDTKMTENNEGSTTDSDSPRQMGAVSTQTSKRNLSNDTNRASETS